MESVFVCPLDGLPLRREENSLRCEEKHTFDLAREGYCNLLPVQNKASANPGDSKEMVAARKRFLDAGFYQPIAEKVASLAKGERVVDAGCGEGYYLDFISRQCAGEFIGYDISKFAVQSAAKRNRALSWAVASNKQPPLAAGTVDLLLSLFGFPIWESFRRMQSAGGALVIVDPAPEHLRELREVIYPEVKETAVASIAGAEAVGYQLERTEQLEFPLALTSQAQIQDLLAMTPHGHRMGQEGRAAVAKLESLKVTAAVAVRVLRAEWKPELY